MSLPSDLTRRQLLTAAGAGAAALLLESSGARAQTPRAQAGRPIVFTHTTVITPDGQLDDVTLAVENGVIAAIGPTEQVQPRYPNADVYDGRGKAIFPGLINCHSHLSATIERGFNEDFGFPNSLKLAVQPGSLLSADERVLMSVIGMLEALETGTTTIIENVGGIAREAAAIADVGQRTVFAESFNDRENASVMSPELLAKNDTPTYSARLRDEGMQRIADLHSAWHDKDNGRISVFPAVAGAENCSGALLNLIREFAEKHDLGYTIHTSQSTWEVDYLVKWHGLRPIEYLAKFDFLGPRLIAAHCRYVSANEIALLGRSRTIVSPQPGMAGNRGANPPIPELRAVDGRFVMQSGKVLTVDEPALIAEADKIGRRVWKRVTEAGGPIPIPGRSRRM